MKAIQTEYKGYLFRSRLEARWAVLFDEMGIRWEYEPEGMILSDGSYYLPDFYLIDLRVYFEVKRPGLKGTPEGEEAVRKIRDGMNCNEWAGVICFGDPMDDDLLIFCQAADDEGGGSYDGWPVTIGFHPVTREPCLLSLKDRKDREFLTCFGDDEEKIPMMTREKYRLRHFITPKVLTSRRKARQARFGRKDLR